MGRIMAFDVGSKRIGIAVSDPLHITAQGIETYERKGERDIDYIASLVLKYDVDKLVFGLPLHMNGDEGASAVMVRELAETICAATGKTAAFEDERLTTMQAERILLDADVSRKKRRGVIDKMAAVIILQSYLEKNN